MADAGRWQIRVDTGGTFTDCWAIEPGRASEPRQVKLLSSGVLAVAVEEWLGPAKCVIELPPSWRCPDDFFTGFECGGGQVDGWDAASRTLELANPVAEMPKVLDLATREEAPVVGVRLLTGTGLEKPLPAIDLRLATTRGTNALLENKGARVALFITRGFGDLLQIRDQRRPDLFALEHHRPSPIPDRIIEVGERLAANGSVLEALETSAIESDVRCALESGCDTAAIALLHSYRNPVHERALRDHLLDRGFRHVSLSSDLAPLIKILPRAETAAIDATLTPVMQEFIGRIQAALGSADLELLTMTSAGGLETPEKFHPKDSLFSGPAGGVVGAAAAGRAAGRDGLITFDMGGTSTDVARYDGDYQYQFEQRVGDATLLSPALKIATVAAGGGSICYRDEAGLKVGPESAGADPGPACYGRGGPLTITDVNLLLGRIDPGNFGIPLGDENIEAARRAALELQGDGSDTVEDSFLEGLLEIAVEQMADSIRGISIREGADPADYDLLAFGGAGPLHACAIADCLEIDTVLVPAEAGILSAYGLHHAVVERFAERQVLEPLAAVLDQLDSWLEAMTGEARAAFAGGTIDAGELEVRRRIAEVRLLGQDATLSVEIDQIENLAAGFRERYAAIFGYPPAAERELELVALRVVVSSPAASVECDTVAQAIPQQPDEGGPRRYLDRASLARGEEIGGPAVIQDPFSTCWVAPGWAATVYRGGRLTLERRGGSASIEKAESRPAAIRHELFRHRFGAIVEEMGAMLERSAISTNVKERLDFSCALLDADARLIVNAPHIPVHLGALGLCVREVALYHTFRPGDMIVTNHPAFGGSHLPDVTVISAVFDAGGERVGYVANRAHHAEIGGCSPGSMPPAATSLAEEGVVIPPTLLFDRGEARFEEIESLLTGGRWPTRSVGDNLADLNAQAAANRRGESALAQLVENHGHACVREEFDALSSLAAETLRSRLAASDFKGGSAEQQLDDGTRIRVRAERSDAGGGLRVDFSGTSPTHAGNLNATPAIVRSAVLYVLRLWTGGGEGLPLNEGLMANIEIDLPRCFLNPEFPAEAEDCPAVVGGNVETSQRLVDTLILLFGLQACSQGTMNNLIFGNDRFGYYETIGGGAGAGPGYDGCGGLHTHMTNTAITDAEILESRYPVRLLRFGLRADSGGAGRHRGGDGLVRELEFLEDLDVSLLTQHRREAPFGMAEGEPGQCGRQILTLPPGENRELESVVAFHAPAGSRLRIETPGGGGYGES